MTNRYEVLQWITTDDGWGGRRGHWYTCRYVEAPNWRSAVLEAFPNDGGKVPTGYRVVLI